MRTLYNLLNPTLTAFLQYAYPPETFVPFAGKTLLIRLVDWSFCCTIHFTESGFSLQETAVEHPDSLLEGTLLSLLKLGCSQEKTVTLLKESVTLQGDIHLVDALRKALHTHPSFHTLLEKYFGQTAAQHIVSTQKKLHHKGQEIQEYLRSTCKEYWLYESSYFPSPEDTALWRESVDTLTVKVDRLAIRIHALHRLIT